MRQGPDSWECLQTFLTHWHEPRLVNMVLQIARVRMSRVFIAEAKATAIDRESTPAEPERVGVSILFSIYQSD